MKGTLDSGKIVAVPITADMDAEMNDLYSRVFAGHPWHEYKKCSKCGINYAESECSEDDCGITRIESKLNLAGGDYACPECGETLYLVDFWRGEPARAVFLDAVKQKRFTGYTAKDVEKDKLVAFSWGFEIPYNDSPSVMFSKIRVLIENAGLDSQKVFYGAETGTDYDYRKRGIATMTSKARLRKAKEIGFEGAIFRTINKDAIRIWERMFGDRKNLNAVFNDPDPMKAERVWYYGDFINLE